MYSLSGVSPIEIPMLRDRSLMWQVEDLPTQQGTLYFDPKTPKETIAVLLQMTYGSNTRGEFLQNGGYGSVYKFGEYALKKFTKTDITRTPDPNFSLSALRANIALSAGLANNPKASSGYLGGFNRRRVHYTYCGPAYAACFIPYARIPKSIYPVWAMSYENGRLADASDLPAYAKRTKLLNRALARSGIKSDYVYLDDDPRNTLVRHEGRSKPGHIAMVELVKFDVQAEKVIEF